MKFSIAYREMEETGNLNSGLFFYIFKFATDKKLNMLIEGRNGTRAGSEHYGQYDNKIV